MRLRAHPPPWYQAGFSAWCAAVGSAGVEVYGRDAGGSVLWGQAPPQTTPTIPAKPKGTRSAVDGQADWLQALENAK